MKTNEDSNNTQDETKSETSSGTPESKKSSNGYSGMTMAELKKIRENVDDLTVDQQEEFNEVYSRANKLEDDRLSSGDYYKKYKRQLSLNPINMIGDIAHNWSLRKESSSRSRPGTQASGGSPFFDQARSEINDFLGTKTGKMVAGGLVGAAGMGILGNVLGGMGRGRYHFSAQDLDNAVIYHAISRDMSKNDDSDENEDSFSWAPALAAAGLLGGTLLMNRIVVNGVNRGKLRDIEFERALKLGTLEAERRDKDREKAVTDIARFYYFSTQDINPHALNVESTQNAPNNPPPASAPTVNIVEPAVTPETEVTKTTEFSKDNLATLLSDMKSAATKGTVKRTVGGVVGGVGKVVGAGVSGAMAIAKKGQESGKAIIRPDGSAGDANIPSVKSNTSDRR